MIVSHTFAAAVLDHHLEKRAARAAGLRAAWPVAQPDRGWVSVHRAGDRDSVRGSLRAERSNLAVSARAEEGRGNRRNSSTGCRPSGGLARGTSGNVPGFPVGFRLSAIMEPVSDTVPARPIRHRREMPEHVRCATAALRNRACIRHRKKALIIRSSPACLPVAPIATSRPAAGPPTCVLNGWFDTGVRASYNTPDFSGGHR